MRSHLGGLASLATGLLGLLRARLERSARGLAALRCNVLDLLGGHAGELIEVSVV